MVPFSSQANLIANVAETLNRGDLTAAIPGFISLVEGKVNADDRFRILPSLVRATAPIADQYVAVPADYISMQNFRLLDSPPPGRVEMCTTSQMDEFRQTLPESDIPKFFTTIGEEFELLPKPDQTYTGQMIYFAMVPPLVNDTDTNWLLTRYPNVYYYGCLLEATPYLKDDSRIAVWSAMYEKIAEDINVSNMRGQFSGSTMKIRTMRRYR